MKKYSDLVFVGIKMNAGPFVDLVDQIEKENHVLRRVGDESSVIRISLAGKL